MLPMLALSNDSKMVLVTLFCVAMGLVVGLVWLIHRQDGSASPRAPKVPPRGARPHPTDTPWSVDGGLPSSVEAILRADPTAKIEAIKAYRQTTGLGLKESKDAIDAWLAGHRATAPVAPTVPPAEGGFPPRVAAMLRERPDEKINAIKVYRETTGVGLKEAKDAVEAWLAQHP